MANTVKIVEKDGTTSFIVNGIEISNITAYSTRKDQYMNGETEVSITFKAGAIETAVEE